MVVLARVAVSGRVVFRLISCERKRVNSRAAGLGALLLDLVGEVMEGSGCFVDPGVWVIGAVIR
jgi:hypothetical protein